MKMEVSILTALREGDTARLLDLIGEDPGRLLGTTVTGNTALHVAAAAGNMWSVTEVCKHRPEFVAVANSKGDTPLHLAARSGQEEILIFLFRLCRTGMGDAAFEKVSGRNRRGDTVLHEAARHRLGHALIYMVEREPGLADMVNDSGEAPLYLAAEKGVLEVVQTLLQYRESCNAQGPDGQTALHAAVCRSHGITQLLLLKRPELSRIVDSSQSTPLHYAVSVGDKKMVQILLRHDASVARMLDKDGLSPIHVAAIMGYTGIIREIIYLCPDSSELTDKSGKNFLHVAIEKKRSVVVEYVLRTDALKDLLIEPDQDGNTPLHLAVINHNREIVHLLLSDQRVDATARNCKGLTPLDLVSSCIDTSIRLRMHKIMVELISASSRFSPQRMDLVTNKMHRQKGEEIIRCRALANNLAIVAVLIATVTFAAAFTLPGGYKGDGSADQGMAVLTRRAAFKAFLISDTMAMVCSIVVTMLLVYTGSSDHDVRLHSVSTAMRLMWAALGGMVVAFGMGVYVVIADDCWWLAIAISVTACSSPFVAWMVKWWPSLDSLRLVTAFRDKKGGRKEHDIVQVLGFQMPRARWWIL